MGAPTILRTYTTAGIGHGAKISYWNELTCSLFSPLEVTPADRAAFDAETSLDELGPISITRISSLPARIEHDVRHIARNKRREFYLMMAVRGRMFHSHYGRDIVLEAGDFMLGDNDAPSRLVFHEPNEAITVVVPDETLRAHIPVPERVCGLHMSGTHGMGSIAAAMLRSLWEQVERGLAPGFGQSIAKNLLDVIATSYAVEYSGIVAESAVTSSRRAQIKRYIETHLRDPRLTPSGVAKFFGVSPRYVRMIFAAHDENVSAYILRRRLEECAEQLTRLVWSGQTIAETASGWGFTSMAHFTRAFKEHFGMTPREYRRRHLAETRAAIEGGAQHQSS